MNNQNKYEFLITSKYLLLLSNEVPKIDDYVTNGTDIAKVNILTVDDPNKHLHFKIIGALPAIDNLPLLDFSNVEKALNERGWFDIEKMSNMLVDSLPDTDSGFLGGVQSGYCAGFYESLQLSKHRIFTEADLRTAIEMARDGNIGTFAPDETDFYYNHNIEDIIFSLHQSKSLFEVEIEMDSQWRTVRQDFKDIPKITNNTIKILSIL